MFGTLNVVVYVVTTDLLKLNLLKPNDIYIRRTAALTSRRYILNIYSTNIHTEYFKHAA